MTRHLKIDPKLAEAIIAVVSELATELDLHYDDEHIVTAGPTLIKINLAVSLLAEAGYSVPPDVAHIWQRYRKSLN